MAYFLLTQCVRCGQPFTCNPDIVPCEVKRYYNKEGMLVKNERAPLCEPCAQAFRRQLEQSGAKPVPIPDGAYQPAAEPTDRDNQDEYEW